MSFILCLFTVVTGYSQTMHSSLSYRRFTTQDGLSQMQSEVVWQDSRGYIYLGTLSGFVRYDGRVLMPFLRGRRENIVDFREVEGQIRALGFRRQWLEEDEHVEMRPIDVESHWLLNNFNATDLPEELVLLEDEQEEHRRLCRIHRDSFETISNAPLFDAMMPDRKLYVDGDDIYVPTSQGLYLLSSGQEKLLSDHPDVYSLVRYDGMLYALAADGLYRVTAQGIAMAFPYAFEAPDYGLMARVTQDGQLFIVDAHTLYCWDGRSMRRVAEGFNLIRCLFIDCWDRLWLATYKGVYCFFNRHFTNHRLADHNDIARAVGVTGGGCLVLGTLNGKIIKNAETFSNDSAWIVACDHPDNFFIPSCATVDGRVYMAGRGQMVCVDSCGSLSWLDLPYERYHFVAASDHRVVFGSRQMIMAYDPLTARTDTLCDYIRQPWCAVSDGHGHLYVGSSTGVHCIMRASDGQYTTTRIDDKPQFFVTTMDADRQGNVYLAASDSLFVIREGQLTHLPMPGLCGHEVRSVHVSPRGYLVIATIDALFVARLVDARIEDVCRFDHQNGFTMIEPLQAVMAETEDGTVWLAGLEEMTSFRPAELIADAQAVTVITPPLPWWQRWWAITLAVLLAVGIVVTSVVLIMWQLHRRKMQELKRKKKQKELQVNAIRLKAIPHFHSNVLAGIEYFLMNNSNADATHYLKLYSDFTNITLTDIDRPARSVAEELDYTRIYLQLEQLRYGERLHYDIRVSDEVALQSKIPNMLIYTYAQNAVKHGIANKPEGGTIVISISRRDNDIVVSVEDDGVGRKQAELLSRNSTKQGLRILMEQIRLYNQTNNCHIRQHITDLCDANGHPSGTRFEMTVPMEYKFE